MLDVEGDEHAALEQMLPDWEEWVAAFQGSPAEIADSLEVMAKQLADKGLDVGEDQLLSTTAAVLHFMLFGERDVWESGQLTSCSDARLKEVAPALNLLLDTLDKEHSSS